MKKLLAILLAIVMVVGSQAAVFAAADSNTGRDLAVENGYAQQLKELGLFKGVSDTNFDLNRAPSRVEAIIMLIRLLGEEGTALSGSYTHPFTDVPAWADAYVGYAYENGLTKGMSATKFGSGTANAQMYTTYVLRALGYSDTDGLDFTYENPFTLAENCGILPSNVDKKNFLRADAVTISHASMTANLKNREKTLAEDLIEKSVFSKDIYADSYNETIQNTFKSEWIGEKKLKITVYGKIVKDSIYIASYGGAGGYYYGEYTGGELINNNYEITLETGWKIYVPIPKVVLRVFPSNLNPDEFENYIDWDNGAIPGEIGYFDGSLSETLRNFQKEFHGLKPNEEKEISGDGKIEITYEGERRFRVHISDYSINTDEVMCICFSVEGDDGDGDIREGYGHERGGAYYTVDGGDFIVDYSKWVGPSDEDKDRVTEFVKNKEFTYEYYIEFPNRASITYTGTYKL